MVLLADDHPLYRAALRQAVDQALPGARLIESADDASLRAEALAHPEADLVLLDLLMSGNRSFATLMWLHSQFAGMAVLIVSASKNPEVMRRAMAFGAAGYVPKSAPLERLVEAIRAVVDCGQWFPPAALSPPSAAQMPHARRHADLAARLASLTPQQFRVLELLAQGKLNKQIAAELGIGKQTTKAHVSAALFKLGARNRTQATLRFKELEILETDQLTLEG